MTHGGFHTSKVHSHSAGSRAGQHGQATLWCSLLDCDGRAGGAAPYLFTLVVHSPAPPHNLSTLSVTDKRDTYIELGKNNLCCTRSTGAQTTTQL